MYSGLFKVQLAKIYSEPLDLQELSRLSRVRVAVGR